MRWRKRINGTLVFRENVPNWAWRIGYLLLFLFLKSGKFMIGRAGGEWKGKWHFSSIFPFSRFLCGGNRRLFSNKWERVGGRWVREWWFSSRKESKLRRSRANFSFPVSCREDLRSDKESNCEY